MLRVLYLVGDAKEMTVTGTPSATVITDNELVDWASGNDRFNNKWWVYMLDVNTVAQTTGIRRRVTDSTSTTLTIAALAANTAANDRYWLMRLDPDEVRQAVLRSCESIYPTLYLPLRDETLVVDDILTNGNMETFAAAVHTGWAISGAGGTVVNEASRVIQGAGAAEVASGAGAAAIYSQDRFLAVNQNRLSGKTIFFRGQVFATAASAGRLGISTDGTFVGTNYTTGPYHGGLEEWEGPSLQQVSLTFPSGATTLTFACEVAAGTNTVFFDDLRAWARPIYRYTMPTTFDGVPLALVSQQDDIDNPNGDYTPISHGNPPRPGHRLRLEGRALLSRPSTDTGSIEVAGLQAELLATFAAHRLCGIQKNATIGEERAGWERRQADLAVDLDRLYRTPGTKTRPGQGIAVHHEGVWHTLQDGETLYLILDQPRG